MSDAPEATAAEAPSTFDLVVIGAGSAGTRAARISAQAYGAKVGQAGLAACWALTGFSAASV